jgi:signal transduction histidine kinase
VDGVLSSQVATTQLDLMLHRIADSLPESERTALTEQVAALQDLLAELQLTKHEHAELLAKHQALIEQHQCQQQLMRLVQVLRQSFDAEEILQQTVIAVQQLLQVERAMLFVVESKTILVAKAANVDQPLPPRIASIDIKAFQAEELLELCRKSSQQTGGIANQLDPDSPLATRLAALLKEQLTEPSTSVLLLAPIGREVPLGLIAAQSTNLRSWQSHQIELLQQLATEAAAVLQHSQLYQQSQQQNLDLEQQVQQRTEQLKKALNYESMLKRITDRVRDSLDERGILEAAVQELTIILKLAGCNAALYDLSQGTSTIHYEYTQSIPTSQGRVAQMEDFPEIYQQLHQGWYFQFCSLLPNPNRGRVAMLTCPIFVDPHSSRGVSQGVTQSVLGDLWLIHQPEHCFDDHEIRLVQQVASQCAIAIRQARLYQAAQVQVQELAELNRLKDEFLSTVSHELRTPITNVKMAVQMLRNAATEEKRKEYLRILEQEAIREADLINDLLDLQQLQSMPRPLELELVSLPDWVPNLIEPFQPRFTARQQSFQVHYPPDLMPVASEPASLRRILAELLNNACKYTAPGGQIYLEIELEPELSFPGVMFRIGNQSSIPAAELPKLFDKFYRCPNADPWKQGGTGLGLALVQKLVERLKGEIQVSSKEGWTKFTVQLPSPVVTAED